MFDKDSNGDISKREMRDAVRRIYRERRFLTASLKVRPSLSLSPPPPSPLTLPFFRTSQPSSQNSTRCSSQSH